MAGRLFCQIDGDLGAAGAAGPNRRRRCPGTSLSGNVVDKVQLERVVDVMQQFLGFDSSFNINSMLTGG